MRFDPRLCIGDRAAYDIEVATTAVLEPVTAFLTDGYPYPLTAEFIDAEIHIRAATGDEVTELLTTGGNDDEDRIDWPGDPASETGHEIVWQETASSDPCRPFSKGRSCSTVTRSRPTRAPSP